MKLVKIPQQILKRKTKKVDSVGECERKELREMAEAMYLYNGVGLAANQVGIDKQLAVIDVGTGLIKMANPIIVARDGMESQDEGCLSCPDVVVKVRRAKKVTVKFLDENGDAKQIEASGLFARAVQHEIDHLSGKLIIDYLNPIKKLFIKKRG